MICHDIEVCDLDLKLQFAVKCEICEDRLKPFCSICFQTCIKLYKRVRIKLYRISNSIVFILFIYILSVSSSVQNL
ncbi:hypothetical protein BpHYR1_017050 [Brachionus plicatilis]|uniref:Uncharacterized protein n=1 Tax=Brachionus plicatilis TaxID=10195 RepID=A0A3M7P8Z9_BRAPC|nr:hypothetical protein BpHYR1_017050 [Brachionus plicatilis]